MLPRKLYLDSIFDDFLTDKPSIDMKCDIYEQNGNYYIEADVPGIDKQDINIECEDGYLTIIANKEEKKEETEKNYSRKERFYGKIQRRFYVGDVDTDSIKATFNNGVLNVTIPKQQEKKASKVINID